VPAAASNSRSINAGGTVNASGADYAEYMRKGGAFTASAGAILGINSDGLLTDQYADAVAFLVKSTSPAYVGGDTWASHLTEPGDAASNAEREQFAADLETARQGVDRMAFAGQVPVNVLGASPGDYIVPVADGAGITGSAVSSPTIAQYLSAVGRVIAIEPDGRSRIIVKAC
jgi:hypothetical protein